MFNYFVSELSQKLQYQLPEVDLAIDTARKKIIIKFYGEEIYSYYYVSSFNDDAQVDFVVNISRDKLNE